MEENRLELLVQRARDHDVDAFAAIYEDIYQDLYRFAYYTLGNRQDAEDAVSETVADAYHDIAKLREPLAFRGWIFKILTAKCKRKRKSYINPPVPLDLNLATAAVDIEGNIDLYKAFSRLNQKEKLIVSLFVFAGYKSIEISRLLLMNHNTVRSSYSRALGKMKQMLE